MDTTASEEVVVLAYAGPGTLAEADAASLRGWAKARGLRLRLPEAHAGATTPVLWSVSDEVEGALARARDGLVAQDAAATERALGGAEEQLRTHPEVPHAAFLLAEVERAWATRYATLAPKDAARAEARARAAVALDGGRLLGVGEGAKASEEHAVPFTLSVTGRGAREVFWDGRLAQEGAHAAAPGRHHVWIRRPGADAPSWSGWVTVAPSGTVGASLPAPEPCTRDDLAGATATLATGVACPRWAAGTGSGAALRVALCHGERCETMGPLADSRGNAVASRTTTEGSRGLPGWVPWALAGVGAVAVGFVVLSATGAFSPATPPPHFSGGDLTVTTAPPTLESVAPR